MIGTIILCASLALLGVISIVVGASNLLQSNRDHRTLIVEDWIVLGSGIVFVAVATFGAP